jgi:hypothetical protein
MLPIVAQLNFALALGAILLQLASVAGILLIIVMHIKGKTSLMSYSAGHLAMPAALLLSLGASIMTLVYSEGFGFIPCGLCWLERIALYPTVLISAAALLMRDNIHARAYIIMLSICGAAVSLYHHYLQMGGSEVVTCPATGVSCVARILFEFNYVTYPLVAFSLFAFIIVALMIQITHERIGARMLA